MLIKSLGYEEVVLELTTLDCAAIARACSRAERSSDKDEEAITRFRVYGAAFAAFAFVSVYAGEIRPDDRPSVQSRIASLNLP
jgi:hypothetical protein